MKLFSLSASLFAAAMLFTACGGGSEPKNDEPAPAAEAEADAPKAEKCSFSYNATDAIINWTAYKHNAKIGVTGKFDTFVIDGPKEAASLAELIQGASFTIDANSVNSGDPVRDPKLVEFFFGKMEDAGNLAGKFSDVTGTNEKGSGQVTIMMNGTSHSGKMNYAVEDGELKVRTKLDMVADFNGEGPFESIGEACAEKHTGSDGERKFWPDVDVTVIVPFAKTCE